MDNSAFYGKKHSRPTGRAHTDECASNCARSHTHGAHSSHSAHLHTVGRVSEQVGAPRAHPSNARAPMPSNPETRSRGALALLGLMEFMKFMECMAFMEFMGIVDNSTFCGKKKPAARQIAHTLTNAPQTARAPHTRRTLLTQRTTAYGLSSV